MSRRFISECQKPGFNLFNNAMTDDRESFVECYEVQIAAYEKWLSEQTGAPTFAQVQQAYQRVQQVVSQDAAVVRDYAKVLTCIDEIGNERPTGSWMFPWQDFLTAAEYAAKIRNQTDEQWSTFFGLYYVSDHCAEEPTGYYLSQAAAWRAEVKRLQSADPSAVKPLADAGIVEILQRPGPAPGLVTTPYFLTLAGRNVLLDGSGTNIPPTPTPEPIPISLVRSQSLTGCGDISIFTSNQARMKRFDYCVDLVIDAINACRGTGTTAEELACGDRLVDGWTFPPLTIVGKCASTDDYDAAVNCGQANPLLRSQERMNALFEATQTAGDNALAVKAAHARVLQCLSGKGFASPPAKLLYHWQRSEVPPAKGIWLKTLTPAERELMEQLEAPNPRVRRGERAVCGPGHRLGGGGGQAG